MATFDFQKAFEAIKNPDLKDVFSHLFTELSTKEEWIPALKKRVAKLEERSAKKKNTLKKTAYFLVNFQIPNPTVMYHYWNNNFVTFCILI